MNQQTSNVSLYTEISHLIQILYDSLLAKMVLQTEEEKKRVRERERERQAEGEKERDRDRETAREADRERETEIERQRERETERERETGKEEAEKRLIATFNLSFFHSFSLTPVLTFSLLCD